MRVVSWLLGIALGLIAGGAVLVAGVVWYVRRHLKQRASE